LTIRPAAANNVFHPCQQAFVVAVPFSYCNDLDMTDTANKAKILIVDDEKDITAILKSGLQEHGLVLMSLMIQGGSFRILSQNTMTKLNGAMTICILTKSCPSAD